MEASITGFTTQWHCVSQTSGFQVLQAILWSNLWCDAPSRRFGKVSTRRARKDMWPAGPTVTHLYFHSTESNVSTWHNKANSVNNSHLETQESVKLAICSRFAFSLVLCIISINSRRKVDCHLSREEVPSQAQCVGKARLWLR